MPKLFISWSGDRSHTIAQALEVLVGDAIQAYQPFISSGVQGGEDWWLQIRDSLSEADVGIAVVTPENLERPWLNFEVGALGGKLGRRVIPYIFGLKKSQLREPISKFQARESTKVETHKLLSDLCGLLPEKDRQPERIERIFETHWTTFESELKAMPTTVGADTPPARSVEDIASEVLLIVRRLERDQVPRVEVTTHSGAWLALARDVLSSPEDRAPTFDLLNISSDLRKRIVELWNRGDEESRNIATSTLAIFFT